MDWGLRCKRELVTQSEARQIAADHGIYLEGLGGTEDGVIGALAAVGLMATKNDGRVVYFGSGGEDWYDVTGCLTSMKSWPAASKRFAQWTVHRSRAARSMSANGCARITAKAKSCCMSHVPKRHIGKPSG